MKRVLIMAGLTALLVTLFAAATFAATGRTCHGYPCNGNSRDNVLYEQRGNGTPDKIHGRGGEDYLDSYRYTNDKDVLIGGANADVVNVRDGDRRDKASGGPSKRDICYVDSRREVGVGCNSVYLPGQEE